MVKKVHDYDYLYLNGWSELQSFRYWNNGFPSHRFRQERGMTFFYVLSFYSQNLAYKGHVYVSLGTPKHLGKK